MGMKQMRNHVGNRQEKKRRQFLIEEAETQIAEIKRRVIQWKSAPSSYDMILGGCAPAKGEN